VEATAHPNLEDRPAPSAHLRHRPMLRLYAYARPYIGLIILASALAAADSATHYARAYLMKPFFDQVAVPASTLSKGALDLSWLPGSTAATAQPQQQKEPAAPTDAERAAQEQLIRNQVRDGFITIVLAGIVLVLLMPILAFAHDYLVSWVLGLIEIEMKVDVCGKLLALPLRYHQDKQRGDVLSRVLGDAGKAQQALELLFADFLEAALMILIGVGVLFFISWQLTLVTLLVGPVIFGVIALFGSRIRKRARRRQLQSAEVTQRLVEILAGIKVIKGFRAEHQEHEGFRTATRRLFRRGMAVVKNRVMSRSLVDALNNASGIGVLLLGLALVLGRRWGLTLGDLAAFSAVSGTLYKPLRSLARGWSRLQDAQPSAERFFEVLDAEVEIRDAADAVDVPRLRESVRFRHVNFSYGREPVLRDIDFEVRAGQVVALVGRTGAGKTTLVDLLLRFYDPTEGSIEIDGVDLRRARRDSLLGQAAVVTQEPFLFDGTIADNIRYGRRDATEADVLAAARAAHVDEFASQLPDGYETEVGGGGTRLSGGQRQRITIARAILRDPALLILDEATSSLDSQSERTVQDALEALLPGRTVFVIAHRLSTVRRADKILVLENGRVSQSGTHAELLAAGGLYRELVSLQTGGVDDELNAERPDTAPPPSWRGARA
jgi:ATP-binding cassette, subfamily B, bacterial MsbA